jgi:hypothetical protein
VRWRAPPWGPPDARAIHAMVTRATASPERTSHEASTGLEKLKSLPGDRNDPDIVSTSIFTPLSLGGLTLRY